MYQYHFVPEVDSEQSMYFEDMYSIIHDVLLHFIVPVSMYIHDYMGGTGSLAEKRSTGMIALSNRSDSESTRKDAYSVNSHSCPNWLVRMSFIGR